MLCHNLTLFLITTWKTSNLICELNEKNNRPLQQKLRRAVCLKIQHFPSFVQIYQLETMQIHVFIEYSKTYCNEKNTVLYLS